MKLEPEALVKCPYCGREEGDWREYAWMCDGCKKKFIIEEQVVYNTLRISCYEDGGEHDYSIEGFSVEKTFVDDGMWLEVADEEDWNYFRVKYCSVCDDEKYIPITREEYLKGKEIRVKLNKMEKRLGKIESVKFGLGGYQSVMIGLHLTLGNDGWGVSTSHSAWDAEIIKCTEYCKWTEKDRDNQYAELLRYVSKLLNDAKVDSVDKLKGVPVEVTFDGSALKEWRVLTEVL